MPKMSSESIAQVRHPLLTGVAAGLIAGAAAGQSERLLSRLVSKKQRRRDRRVRAASAHEVAGPYFARKITGRRLSEKGKKRAQVVFSLAYGVGWGLIHAGLRKRFPRISRWAGLPFALPFFFACDGTLAPLLGVSPSLRRIPWQPSVREIGNHIAWTAAAELVHRAMGKARR